MINNNPPDKRFFKGRKGRLERAQLGNKRVSSSNTESTPKIYKIKAFPFFLLRLSILLLDAGVHFHVQYPAVFTGVFAQNPLTQKARFFQHPAGRRIIRKGLGKNANDVGIVKHMTTGLSDGACTQSLSPICFPEIISQLGRSGVNVCTAADRNTADRPVVHRDGKGKIICGISRQHGADKFFCILSTLARRPVRQWASKELMPSVSKRTDCKKL